MPIITCPACSTKLDVSDDAIGKQGKCPKCALVFPMTAESSPNISARPMTTTPMLEPSASTFSAEPMTRFDRSANDDIDIGSPRGMAAWSTTRTGFWFLYFSLIVILISTIVSQSLLAFVVATTDGDPFNPMAQGGPGGGVGPMQIFVIVNGGLGCFTMVAALMAIVGMIMICFAPDKTVRARAVSSVVCLAIATVLMLGLMVFFVAIIINNIGPGGNGKAPRAQDAQFIEQMLKSNVGGIIGLIVAAAIMFASVILWILMHAAIGTVVNNPKLRRSAFSFLFGALIIYGLSLGVNLGLRYVFTDPIRDFRMQTLISTGVGLVMMIVIYGWYLSLCRATIRAISNPI